MAYVSKTSVAVNAIRVMIETGEVAPGHRFDVRRMAESLGMSITPVREALRILQSEGVISYDEHRSISVIELSSDDAEELYHLRSRLEAMAAERAAQLWTPEFQSNLADLHKQFRKAVADGDLDGARDLNRRWHFAIYHAAGARFIEPMIARLWGQFAWSEIWRIPGRLDISVKEHERIMRAFKRKNPQGVSELMSAHILSSASSVERH